MTPLRLAWNEMVAQPLHQCLQRRVAVVGKYKRLQLAAILVALVGETPAIEIQEGIARDRAVRLLPSKKGWLSATPVIKAAACATRSAPW
jgi:hypothetical protein